MSFWDLAGVPGGAAQDVAQANRNMLRKLGYSRHAEETVVHVSRMHGVLRKRSATASSASTTSSSSVAFSAAAAVSGKKRSRDGSAHASPRYARLRRLTVQIDASEQFDILGSTASPEMQHFDILAAMPTTADAFARACARDDLDLIALEASSKLDFALRPDLVLAALKRGLRFELRYANALQSATCRHYFIANAAALLRASRGRGVILSSASSQPLYLRGHHDLANLMLLCGVRGMEMALDCVSTNCQAVVDRAFARRLARGAKDLVNGTTTLVN